MSRMIFSLFEGHSRPPDCNQDVVGRFSGLQWLSLFDLVSLGWDNVGTEAHAKGTNFNLT